MSLKREAVLNYCFWCNSKRGSNARLRLGSNARLRLRFGKALTGWTSRKAKALNSCDAYFQFIALSPSSTKRFWKTDKDDKGSWSICKRTRVWTEGFNFKFRRKVFKFTDSFDVKETKEKCSVFNPWLVYCKMAAYATLREQFEHAG